MQNLRHNMQYNAYLPVVLVVRTIRGKKYARNRSTDNFCKKKKLNLFPKVNRSLLVMKCQVQKSCQIRKKRKKKKIFSGHCHLHELHGVPLFPVAVPPSHRVPVDSLQTTPGRGGRGRARPRPGQGHLVALVVPPAAAIPGLIWTKRNSSTVVTRRDFLSHARTRNATLSYSGSKTCSIIHASKQNLFKVT